MLDPRIPSENITGLVLAGGRSLRMGGMDKGLINLAGRPMIAHILESLIPQVSEVIINANRNLDHYTGFGYRVIPDIQSGFAGPLAGIASAMEQTHNEYLLVVPCDCPLLEHNLATRLYQSIQAQKTNLSVAFDGTRIQPVFALLKTCLLPSLNTYLKKGNRKVDLWYAQEQAALTDFSASPQMFFNVNTPEQRNEIDAMLRQSVVG